VVVGASVILFDPIFQGLAISLMAGEVASTVLSRMTVQRGAGLPWQTILCSGNEEGGAAVTVERYLRMIAGAFVVLSLALGLWFPKTTSDFKINKVWHGRVTLLHG